MPIHEKSLIRPEDIRSHDKLTIDGVDVSGHWSTFITSRAVTDYNETLEDEIAALPGGEFIHRCWQCGSCTNACTVNAIEPRFNPRYWIYLIRMGLESELLRDKDIIWQCVSCNKCTYACPRDVVPEAVMKATQHWMELKGHVAPSASTVFDDVFTHQVVSHGKIEDARVLTTFLKRTNQPLFQDWIKAMVLAIVRKLPVVWGLKSMLALLIPPRTSGWRRARAAIEEYIHERELVNRAAVASATSEEKAHDATPATRLAAAE